MCLCYCDVLYNEFSYFIVGILVNAKTETVQHGPARRAGTFANAIILGTN